MNKSDFAEILTALFNGNAGEARQVSEQMLYDDTFNISDEYDRRKQDRINYFEVLKLRKTLDIWAEMWYTNKSKNNKCDWIKSF